MQLKVLSWNIWIDGYFDLVLDFLEKSNADIIGLQEVVADDPKRDIIGFLNNLGYEHVFSPARKGWGNKIWNDGPAVFSKRKIVKSETFILSKSESRAAATAEIMIGNRTLYVFSTHLIHTHQQQSEIQEEQAKNLLKLVPPNRAILMGDFNAEPTSSAIKIISQSLVNSDPLNQPTWSVYPEGCETCSPQKIDLKLDYIFTTKGLKTSNFKVENSKASDHLPISVNVDF